MENRNKTGFGSAARTLSNAIQFSQIKSKWIDLKALGEVRWQWTIRGAGWG